MADQQAQTAPDAAVQRRNRAALLEQAIEQGTGDALRVGAMAAAFHGELLRKGVTPAEAVQITGKFVDSTILSGVMKLAVDEDRKRDGWHP